ncbi:GNAT family N-acetyltransferase [Flavobacterium subsaxonicum]|uniref:GNAT family acetyltransferase n=1 Tax=Flavobacterium subsaxonicum WB 4.1-42 = DSM 21790 TaxID=1121898 RepID=A0A0A2MJC5_9FLAO|nr:GNAT family N-acetyltransferase [Flavobacterium subsaxonicum]KGO92712.1 GNAT family acetyltransferase [Flavobacterium subsaxonicum WB 4.1-42 = DSM 21790]
MDFKTFKTERLLLRPTDATDAAFILKLLNTPKWIQFVGDRKVTTVAEARAYIANRMTPQLNRLGYGNYTMVRKSDGKKIGTCGLYDREGLSGIDIGFALLPQFEKQGYAFEAVSQLKDAAVNLFNMTEISGITTKDNTASQNLLVKIGLSFEKFITIPNDDVELCLYRWVL